MNIKPGDLVLEGGSGDKPHPRSHVLLDKFPEDSSEREARRNLVIDRSLSSEMLRCFLLLINPLIILLLHMLGKEGLACQSCGRKLSFYKGEISFLL